VASSSIPAGLYSVTAVARDAQGRTATSSAIQVKISKALKAVRNTRKNASVIESSATSNGGAAAQGNKIDAVVAELEQAYFDLHSERAMFDSADRIENYLFAAFFLARSSASLAKQGSLTSAVTDRMSRLDAYLGFCEDLMVNGVISAASLAAASQVNADANLIISQPETLPVHGSGSLLSPGIEAKITGSPMATETVSRGQGGAEYELGNVSVTIQGKAAEMVYVSSTFITFIVPADLTPGVASVVLTSRDGFISHGTASVSGLNPTIFLNAENSNRGAILDALNVYSGSFSTVTPAQYLGLDTRTRLSIFATGISTGISNTNPGNDVWLANGQMLPNLAESVVVEARKSDGTIISLPVEYAGMQGVVPGLDQVTVVLPGQLAGAGSVQLTIVISGVRSNTITLVVQ
jgi:uncharacterized protein (TIGR03437 family)